MAAVTALLCPGTALAAGGGASAEAKAIGALNKIRAANNLAPLRASRTLARSANAYSRYMLDHDFFGHQPRIPVAAGFRTAGETLAWHSGYSPGARRTVRAWMSSPPHRAVLLSSAYSMVGMGMEMGDLSGRATTMWVAHFGHR